MPKKFSTDWSKETRQQEIYNILRYRSEDSSMTASEVVEALERKGCKASSKTILRDLQEDMEQTHGIRWTETKPHRFYVDAEFKPTYQLNLSEWELQTMTHALDSFREMGPPHLKEPALKAEVVLLSKVPKGVAEHLEKIKSITAVTPAFRGESGIEYSQAYRLVMRALLDGVVIKCRNISPYKDESSGKVIRTFSPLFLHIAGSEHYLIALDHEDQQVKRLKVCRLHDIEVTSQKFDTSIRIKYRDVTSSIGGFGGAEDQVMKYTITCDKLMATLFQERKIHSSQQIRTNGTDYFITFEANPSKEIIRDLAGWAMHIKDVQPAEVMNELMEIWEAGLNKRKDIA